MPAHRLARILSSMPLRPFWEKTNRHSLGSRAAAHHGRPRPATVTQLTLVQAKPNYTKQPHPAHELTRILGSTSGKKLVLTLAADAFHRGFSPYSTQSSRNARVNAKTGATMPRGPRTDRSDRHAVPPVTCAEPEGAAIRWPEWEGRHGWRHWVVTGADRPGGLWRRTPGHRCRAPAARGRLRRGCWACPGCRGRTRCRGPTT